LFLAQHSHFLTTLLFGFRLTFTKTTIKLNVQSQRTNLFDCAPSTEPYQSPLQVHTEPNLYMKNTSLTMASTGWSKEALITLIGLIFTLFCTIFGLVWRWRMIRNIPVSNTYRRMYMPTGIT
jgi:hypothetical protein